MATCEAHVRDLPCGRIPDDLGVRRLYLFCPQMAKPVTYPCVTGHRQEATGLCLCCLGGCDIDARGCLQLVAPRGHGNSGFTSVHTGGRKQKKDSSRLAATQQAGAASTPKKGRGHRVVLTLG